MSTIELREMLRALPRAERQEMLAILQEMEAADPAPELVSADSAQEGGASLALPPVVVPFGEAVDKVFGKHREVLGRLAQ